MIGQEVLPERAFAARAVNTIRASAAVDSLAVGLVALISAVPYVGHLGFYSDDWSFIGALATARDHSFGGLFSTLLPQVEARPVQAAYIAGAYELFGANPVPFQVITVIALTCGGILAYLTLRRFGFNRVVAMIAAMIYISLPTYSSDRLWLAAAQALISMCFFFGSAYSLARAAAPDTNRWPIWLAASGFALLLSALAYEVFLPLFVISALALPLAVKVSRRRQVPLMVVGPALVVLVGLFKVATTTRLGGADLSGRLVWLMHLVKGALVINFWDYGLGLPVVAASTFVAHPVWSGAAAAAAAAGLVYAAVIKAGPSLSIEYRRVALAGGVCFAGGYAIFLTNNNALFTPTGSGNRVNVAAAFGMALLFTAGVWWVADRMGGPRAKVHWLGALAALVVGAGVLTNVTLASYWEEASTTQTNVLAALKRDQPVIPPGATLVIDGVCPYAGPGVVFETTWDVTGALRTLYSSPTLSGDIVTTRMSVAADGLHSYTYQTETVHPYGDLLLMYDFRSHTTSTLRTESDALTYLVEHPAPNCAAGSPGYGAPVI